MSRATEFSAMALCSQTSTNLGRLLAALLGEVVHMLVRQRLVATNDEQRPAIGYVS